MRFFGWSSTSSNRDSEPDRNAVRESLAMNDLSSTTESLWSRPPSQTQPTMNASYQNTYPFMHHSNPYRYHQFSPQYFGSQPAVHGQFDPSSRNTKNESGKPKVPSHPALKYPPPGYGYYAYPEYPVPANPQGSVSQTQTEGEDLESNPTRTGMMKVEGQRPLFLVALFVVSIAVLLISFPLTLLSAGYIGPLGLMFATGPFATVFAFWAIYLTPCECYPNVEWAVSRIRVFATTAAVFDAVGTIGVPISMYGAQCPDDDDTMLGCEDELPAAKGVSLAVAVVLGTHCFLCLLVRSNARKLAESKFGDERTEGIVLTPTPFK